jgi:hypothetical protein
MTLFTFIYYLCGVKVTIYQHTDQLPQLNDGNFFHSRELMELCEHTPRLKPYMAVVFDDAGNAVAHLLALMRFRRLWLPPYLYTHVRIYGDNDSSAEHFSMMMTALTQRLQNRTIYMEMSHLREKMFGYRELRQLRFFPVRWMKIHNSLHSRTPEERISEQQMQHILHAQQRGAETKPVETAEEFEAASRLLHRHHWLKPKRYIPDNSFFREMMKHGKCQILITKYHERVIGTTVTVFSEGDAYLWYSASLRKSYAPLHPNAVTMWATIKAAHAAGYQHIRFMDVGLPFRHNPYRDFILRFGGKEVSAYRWFRISIRWINSLASWLWRE